MYVYADNAATTCLSQTALEAMTPYFTKIYGNASSLHTPGQEAANALVASRQTIARLLNADPKEIYFTSGGSESDTQAILSAARTGARKGKKHIVSTAFEHHAVLHTLESLKRQGFEITLLDVHENGIVTAEEAAAAIREDTALVTVMFANNEIGTLQPIAEIGAVCREKGVLFHTDAVQAVGHVPVDVRSLGVDMLSLSAHKFCGPKGVGALYVRKGVPLSSLIEGGQQERGKRGGTENIPGIVGMAAAMEEAVEGLDKSISYVTALRERLIEGLLQIPHSRLNGDRDRRVPGTVNFCFEGIEGESLLLLLDAGGVAASSGSACTSGSLDPSHVLLALGLPHEVAHGSLRLSIGDRNTPEEIDHILAIVPGIVQRLRDISPVWDELEKGERPHLL